ncbi:electron transfer flavoprotein subunit beta/FixA family protein [Candidatus Profftella armatura]|uniref:Electron transfer flavoprotein subunit beta n=1 Tax=Candidatus Profftella armatura TaxID=669502 RepID=S5R427_9PROT|nr:electron transfer flavoprotein subunit beta/FixA family protein [Candidatus Profftella armatura]AGS06974.1 electron transfer flavoprotein subunit beta [Candidatus Profftella armatura]ALC96040.1 electron transporter RnfB [Candidatus Profftella armatura]QLK13965.1 electron transfer flavoprotein subunit beta/FixA family protein [Candidatus Profftella armatura]
MKILVPIKRVVNYNTKINIKPDYTNVDISNTKMSINPFDEIAIESAIRLRESSNKIKEIIAISCGNKKCKEILQIAMAMGVDRAILIETDTILQSLSVAKLLQVIVKKENPQLVILGKQSIDSDNNQTGQMLAALLNWPQATFASKIVLKKNNKILVTQEIEDGKETILLSLPAIITTDLRMNEPRYVTLMNIIKARKKNINIFKIDELNVNINTGLNIIKVKESHKNNLGIKVKNVIELIDKLKNEAKII